MWRKGSERKLFLSFLEYLMDLKRITLDRKKATHGNSDF